MRVLAQRSLSSRVEVDNKVVGSISKGLVLLVSFTDGDTKEKVEKMVSKVLKLRIFDDEEGVMNKSIPEDNEILSISQFTLYADTKKGNRPSYINALKGEDAVKLYNYFNEVLAKSIKVETGIFGAEMKVNITNDGPVTILLEL